MSIDLQKEPDYEKIIDALIDKTKEGKLQWQETADERTFLAAVRGERTFQISQDWEDALERFQLVIRDADGRAFVDKLFYIARPVSAAANKARNLYELVRRISLNLDEKVDETVQLLNGL
jgi:hypothetical protein